MCYSIWLLAATCLANGPAPALTPIPAASAPAAPTCTACAAACDADQEQGFSLGRRLANLFRGRRHHEPGSAYQTTGVIYVSPQPEAAATSDTLTPIALKTLQQVPARTPAHDAPALAEAPKETVERVAIADDASWVIGQLSYVHAGGGIWLLRYAPLDTEDRYGGGVVLAPGADMSKFHEGDIVFVRGSIVNEGRGSKYVGGPLYRATNIELNERAGD
jgi:hypothetical protein